MGGGWALCQDGDKISYGDDRVLGPVREDCFEEGRDYRDGERCLGPGKVASGRSVGIDRSVVEAKVGARVRRVLVRGGVAVSGCVGSSPWRMGVPGRSCKVSGYSVRGRTSSREGLFGLGVGLWGPSWGRGREVRGSGRRGVCREGPRRTRASAGPPGVSPGATPSGAPAPRSSG